MTKDTFICRGESIHLESTGGEKYNWYPNLYLNDNFISNPISTPDTTITYHLSVQDTNNCVNYKSTKIIVQQEPEILLNDTAIIIGETVIVDVYSDIILSYEWSPEADISCANCHSISLNPTEPVIYTVIFADTSGCFIKSEQIFIDIIKEYTVDVPAAFSPNGDTFNDVIYVRGWGILELIEFKIFNRYGEMVYSSNDIKQGWDGYYNGKPQNIETYTYLVKIRTYENDILYKTGTIKLLR